MYENGRMYYPQEQCSDDGHDIVSSDYLCTGVQGKACAAAVAAVQWYHQAATAAYVGTERQLLLLR